MSDGPQTRPHEGAEPQREAQAQSFASVRSLCNLDRLDSLLQAVLSKVESHDRKLLRVDDDIKNRALGEELGRANAALAKHIQSLSIKIDGEGKAVRTRAEPN